MRLSPPVNPSFIIPLRLECFARQLTDLPLHAWAYVETAPRLQAAKEKKDWDFVVVDPPSFAPNKASVPAARAAYEKVFAAAARVTAPGGILAAASCSSHIDDAAFMELCEAALGRSRRQGASVLRVAGQPADHPFPAACSEMRYLKFAMFRLSD